MKSIVLCEHKRYEKDDCQEIKSFLANHNIQLTGCPEGYRGEPPYLCLNNDLEASYYIGASWLVEDELHLIVRPKYENLDFVEMLITALSVKAKNVGDYFAKCYGIDFDGHQIETEENLDQLTPILLLHYLTLLEKVVQAGLKKGYVTIEDNLKLKIKGHIMMPNQIRHNLISKRTDRNYCRYQIYTSDIPENRLLKKALLFSQLMLNNLMKHGKYTAQIQSRINKLNCAFEEVSDRIEISQVKSLSTNKLFRQYPEAIRVAKSILRRFDYSISEVSAEKHKTPPFWIDMSGLFELYVYSKLEESYSNMIGFQVEGNGNVADYIHKGERLIIDAKYKKIYKDSYDIMDIREVSCYARDIKILKNFGTINHDDNDEIKCLIIYPDDGVINKEEPLWSQSEDISKFKNFRKFGIKIPIKEEPR